MRMIIIYISLRMHSRYKGILICTPMPLTLSLSADVEQPQSGAFSAQQHYSCCKASHLHSARENTLNGDAQIFTHAPTPSQRLQENKDSVGHGVHGAQGL